LVILVKKRPTDHQQRLEKFLQHYLEEARKLRQDWLKYGLDYVDLYVEHMDGWNNNVAKIITG
jgi:adenine-specific DNA methylase